MIFNVIYQTQERVFYQRLVEKMRHSRNQRKPWARNKRILQQDSCIYLFIYFLLRYLTKCLFQQHCLENFLTTTKIQWVVNKNGVLIWRRLLKWIAIASMHLSVASVYGITFEPTFKCLLEEVTLCGKFKMYYNNNNDKFVECFFSMIQKLCYIKNW